ncbi:hypothetical protein AB0C86_04605 [Streptomyces lavendulae]|uniref:hypothetical protein n=1 Tax=Streptomyces lavendulae TaxID=1914 RepID=UPI0034054E95
MADETGIEVSAATRDRPPATGHPRPADRAGDRMGTTIRQLVEELAEGRPTRAGCAERAEQARAELASVLGTVPGKEAEAKARGLLERLGARQDPSAA